MTPRTLERPSISPPMHNAVGTGADTESLARTTKWKSDVRPVWQNLIDHSLAAWLRDPSALEDEGVDAPKGMILRSAIDYAEESRDVGALPPYRVVPDANGGIVFEWKYGEMSEAIHFWDDGEIEAQTFRGSELLRREPL